MPKTAAQAALPKHIRRERHLAQVESASHRIRTTKARTQDSGNRYQIFQNPYHCATIMSTQLPLQAAVQQEQRVRELNSTIVWADLPVRPEQAYTKQTPMQYSPFPKAKDTSSAVRHSFYHSQRIGVADLPTGNHVRGRECSFESPWRLLRLSV